MKVTLEWVETNYGEDGYKIYRSTSPIDPQNLPTPLDTIGENSTSYEDTTVVSGETYYYRVSSYQGAEEVVSDEVVVEVSDFSPSNLFASGEQGFWYDFSDLSTLFKDTAGTDPVTADGDLIARVNDKSGNGNFLTQSTSTWRPAYRTDGNLHWAEFRSGDYLDKSASPIAKGVGSAIAVVGLKDETIGSGNEHFLSIPTNGSDTSTRILLRTESGDFQIGGRRLDSDGFQRLTVAKSGTNSWVYLGKYDYLNSDLDMRLNGVVEASSTSFQSNGSTSNTDANGIGLGANADGSSEANTDITQVILTAGNADNFGLIPGIEEYIALKTGITL